MCRLPLLGILPALYACGEEPCPKGSVRSAATGLCTIYEYDDGTDDATESTDATTAGEALCDDASQGPLCATCRDGYYAAGASRACVSCGAWGEDSSYVTASCWTSTYLLTDLLTYLLTDLLTY